MRTFVDGKLATSKGYLLPFNTSGLPNAGGPSADLFLAGDVRANEQVGLTAMHTMFVREHNRLADLLALEMPGASDEDIYQVARKIVGAELQIVTYNEFVPALLGPDALPEYSGYDANVDPSIANEFSTAFYRFGHSMLSPDLLLVGANPNQVDALPLREAFFNPGFLADSGNKGHLDKLLRGLASQPAQEIDNLLVDDVRNFLFGPPGAGGLDLASLNIQRGRDHGLPDYNALRVAYGLEPVQQFSDISSDAIIQQALESLYGDVDNIDAWVGGLTEEHAAESSVGELIHTSLVDQFTRLRDGDRFFYLNDPDLSDPVVTAVIDLNQVTLADIIRNNTKVKDIQDNVFLVAGGAPLSESADSGSAPIAAVAAEVEVTAWAAFVLNDAQSFTTTLTFSLRTAADTTTASALETNSNTPSSEESLEPTLLADAVDLGPRNDDNSVDDAPSSADAAHDVLFSGLDDIWWLEELEDAPGR